MVKLHSVAYWIGIEAALHGVMSYDSIGLNDTPMKHIYSVSFHRERLSVEIEMP